MVENLEIKNQIQKNEFTDLKNAFEKYQKETASQVNLLEDANAKLTNERNFFEKESKNLKRDLDFLIENSEQKLIEKLKESQQATNNSIKSFNYVNERDLEDLNRKMKVNIKNYMESVEKSIGDYNEKVTTESIDLFTCPKDYQFGKSPGKKLEKSPAKSDNVKAYTPIGSGLIK